MGAEENLDYDPISITGIYKLDIEVMAVQKDSDPNNTIAEAIESNASSLGTRNVSINDAIDPSFDADIYRFELEQGDGVTVSVNTFSINSELDSFLRLFDAEGNELLSDDDDDNNIEDSLGTDSLLNFVPDTSGVYYLGVSSDGNTTYDSLNGTDNLTPNTGLSAGNYNLELDIAEVVPDSDPDNTIAESSAIELSTSGEPISISEAIDTIDDTDLYQLELEQGNTVSFDIDTLSSDFRLDSVLQVFDADGNQLAFNDDDSAPDENSELDSYLEFTALATGKYYVGVSSYGNLNYDPLEGRNNFSSGFGSTTGNYDLVISTLDSINTVKGAKTADSLAGTEQTDLIVGLDGNDSISGAAQGDIILGDLGNDFLQGEDGDDFLQGGKGADELLGGLGNDTLDGEEGSDLLYGNEGADIFIVGRNSGEDTLADFETGIDKIVLLDGVDFANLSLIDNVSLGGTTVSYEDEILANILAIAPEQLTVEDFISE